MSSAPRAHRRPRRTAYHHGDLRAALIRVSLDLVDRHGVHGFTMSHAARAAGVAVSAPYRHFADRESLLAEIAAAGFLELATRLTNAHADGMAGVEAMARAYVAFAHDRRPQFRVMFEAGLDKAAHPALSLAGDRAFAILLAATTELAGRRASATTRSTVTATLWSLIHGFAVLSLDGAFAQMLPGLDQDQLLRRSVALVLAGM